MIRALPVVVAVVAVLGACGREAPAPNVEAKTRPKQTLRVAVVGGMMETGFWPEIAARYERTSGDKIELAATGPKPQVVAAFKKGGIDVITVHASDAMVNLVADGLARDPQPWVRNDMVIDELTRGEQHDAADVALADRMSSEGISRGGANRTEDSAEHLLTDTAAEHFGTGDMSEAIERGYSYNPPDTPVQEGSLSKENH